MKLIILLVVYAALFVLGGILTGLCLRRWKIGSIIKEDFIMKKSIYFIMLLFAVLLVTSSCSYNKDKDTTSTRPEENVSLMLPANRYALAGSVEVKGRQGVCSEGNYYWVSGSTTLAKYDKDWNLIAFNEEPFKGYETEVNHIADIDVYQNELYIGAEYFMDGVGKNIQIAIYDGDTLELKRTFSFEAGSGQLECSGIAVDPDTKTVWMCSWVGEESGRYLYQYDLITGHYLRKVHMQMPPQWIQGIAYHNGCFYLTADDGTADDNEPDHLYRTKIEPIALLRWNVPLTTSPVKAKSRVLPLTRKTVRFLFFITEAPALCLVCPKVSMTDMTEKSQKCLLMRSNNKKRDASI